MSKTCRFIYAFTFSYAIIYKNYIAYYVSIPNGEKIITYRINKDK